MMHVAKLKSATLIPLQSLPTVRHTGIRTADAGSLIRAISDQVMTDLHDLETRFLSAKKARDLSPESIGYGRGVEEHVELIVSVIAIASLAEYRRGEPVNVHRLPFACDPAEVRERLDRIRAILRPLACNAPSYYRFKRYRREFVRAMSALFLALDAIPDERPDLILQILAFSPISQMTCDPQGDAQDWGERIDADL